MIWQTSANDPDSDVVLSSRIRLARNLKKYSFPSKLDTLEANNVIQAVNDVFSKTSSTSDRVFDIKNMDTVTPVDKIAMMERHVISPNFIRSSIPTGLIVSKDETLSIMINEEDHLRIQSIAGGRNLQLSFDNANKIDDLIEEKLEYAYNEKLGYLTTCLTNVGTGMRASYMVHVPALETTGQLQFILEAIGKFGLTVRGIYGEGTKAQGSLFQISNQITLGHSEKEIIDNLNSVTTQIVDQERLMRTKLLKEKKITIEDAVYRSYGVLSHARTLTSDEAMTLLSDIKLGCALGILEFEEKFHIYELMMLIQPANLQKAAGKELDGTSRDIERAAYIRQSLPKLKSL